ncbi:MAG: flagellar hook-basal body complex protein FliE [Thiotrichales bacterium]
MEPISSQQVLSQLRALAQQAGLQGARSGTPGTTPGAEFSGLLQESIRNVNRRQQVSGRLREAFELGEPGVDLPQVMLESQKSRIAFETLLRVRNKLIDAYKEIMNMPV